uniref:Thiamin biosynthesis protein S n=1 Tax=Polysiphonia sertularioides TaxID=945028 RepID=A0A1Z1M900_9FLOR|nr:thiamin biosynthesis protein S [Polysiphonia sertularioides]ARW62577.1 thiamin biosynthesis protein S [Polysiphonia sertularioides]
MQNYLTIFINGNPFNCNSSMSLFDLLTYLEIEFDSTIVEYNHSIIDKDDFRLLYIKNNDSLEFMSVVGGG